MTQTQKSRDWSAICRLILTPMLRSEDDENITDGLNRLARYAEVLSDEGSAVRVALQLMESRARVDVVAESLLDLIEIELSVRILVDQDQTADGCYARGLVRRLLAGADRIALGLAVRDFAIALLLTDPKKRPDFFHLVVRELCETVPVAACRESDLASALRHLTSLFDFSRPGRPALNGPIDDSWRRWLIAVILIRFGSHRRAAKLLDLCRDEFARRRLVPEFLAASLDFAECIFHDVKKRQRRVEMNMLGAEMVFRFRLTDCLESHSILLAWRDRALHGGLTCEAHEAARVEIGRWLRIDLERRAADPQYQGPSFVEVRSGEGR